MQTQHANINYPQRIATIILKVILFIFLFIILVFLLLLTPPVQKFATNKVENYLEQKLKTRVDIGSISIGLPRRVVLNDVYIEDRTKDTLVSGGSIKANITLFKLLSNEVQVKDIQLDNITAKIKRLLPDTTFNFQFIVDAFAVEQTKQPDTAQTAPLKLDVDHLAVNNSRIIYKDVITGSDMSFQVGLLDATIDSLNPYTPNYDINTLNVKDVVAVVNQSKPLVTPEPLSKDIAEATAPITMKLNFGTVNLDNVSVNYGNDVSAFYTQFNIDKLLLDGRNIDLQNRIIHFDELRIDNTLSAIRMGKKEQAKLIAKEVKQEVAAQQQNNWIIRVDNIELNNNQFLFDNDNEPALRYGMDYAHMKADSLTLHIQNFVLNTDTIGGLITKGYFKEKSGFQLDALQADILYAKNQSYLKNLYLKTPGTELKRDAILEYESYDALVKNFPATVMDIDIEDSRVQVKDILTFAPQLRTHPAFKRPNDVWRINLQGSGTVNRLHIDALQFNGLSNTQIDASGTLASLTDPTQAGGTFTIRRLHTNQTDISLFTGQRLSTPDVALPESFDASGTLSGNAANMVANVNVTSSAGFVAVNGRFSNLAKPEAATYNAVVRTNGLRLGSILKNPSMGNVTANMRVTGSGFTPDAINTKFDGTIYSIGLNNYTYHNAKVKGSLRKTVFNVTADINDPNADLKATVSGNYAGSPSFKIDAFVDSLKTLPLHLTTQPLIFRGKIDGDIASLDPDYLKANVLVTDALLVSGKERLPLDSLQLVADKSGNNQYIRLTSEIANAAIEGQYRFAELGTIIQHNIQPYFSVAPARTVAAVHPYDFTFSADLGNSPFLSSLIPGLTITEPLHASGSLATNRGLEAQVVSEHIVFQNYDLQNLNAHVTTTPNGLQLNGTVGQIKSGTLNVYNTRLNATALNNNINFNLAVDDKASKNKYYLGGLVTQPSLGTYAIQLRPDSLLLNYERWTVSPDNRLVVSPTAITANNFVLSKDGQQLALQSLPGNGVAPLNVTFTNFQLGTITGFMQADTLLANGTMNGTVTFKNLMEQPLFTSDLTINNLSMKQDTIGNVHLLVNSPVANRYIADITLSGRGNDARITGTMVQQGSEVLLDLDARLQQLQLNTLKGAMAGFLTDASGSINGNISINGTLSQPKALGTINFDNTAISTTLLGGPLTIDNEKLTVTENGFAFNQFTIRDSANNALNLNGTIGTTNFINYNFDLDVAARNFRALNTTRKQNDIYFGQLYLTTNMHIGGTEQEPVVDGAVTVTKGTNFSVVIPQAEPGVVQREGVVEFIDFDAPGLDTLFRQYDSLNVSNLVGFDVSTNITIEKEANLNVIVDVANGDFLNLRGAGLLSAGIDPSGKITLTGSYEIEEGAYQISFNFLRRKFDIEKGSKITWLGEPTNAQVDVTAIYIANTAPLDLLENQIEDARRNYYMQRLPFEVLLKLRGELMKPDITFDVVLPEDKNYNVSGEVEGTVRNRLEQLRQEPAELNKQVFAILLLNRFVGENPFESSTGGFSAGRMARQSVSKLLTEQLNSLAAGLVNGVDINFDVASSDDYTTGNKRARTDLNVGLSKRLLNDRLTVTVGSNFLLQGPQQVNQPSSNIAGDVSVNYQLSPDGRYMIRFYRQNEYEGTVDGYVIETGMGFIMTVDYNRFRQIFESRRTREQRQQQRQQKRELRAQNAQQQTNTQNPQN